MATIVGPGGTISFTATIKNIGAIPYAWRVIGGVSNGGPGDPSALVATGDKDVTLQPGESYTASFTLTMPPGTFHTGFGTYDIRAWVFSAQGNADGGSTFFVQAVEAGAIIFADTTPKVDLVFNAYDFSPPTAPYAYDTSVIRFFVAITNMGQTPYGYRIIGGVSNAGPGVGAVVAVDIGGRLLQPGESWRAGGQLTIPANAQIVAPGQYELKVWVFSATDMPDKGATFFVTSSAGPNSVVIPAATPNVSISIS